MLAALLCLGGLRAQDAGELGFYAAAPEPGLRRRAPGEPRGLPLPQPVARAMGRFVSYGASYDVFIPKINSGFGVIFSSDEAGTGAVGSSSFAFQYSYEVPINDSSFRPGCNSDGAAGAC